MEEESIQDLAKYIINEIEREDFFEAMKHYGEFKIITTADKILDWWEEI